MSVVLEIVAVLRASDSFMRVGIFWPTTGC